MSETQPAAQLQPDMGRVVQRAANNAAGAVADLSAQLAMIQEVAELRAERIQQLEREATEKDAELARARQTAELLQQRIDDGGDGGDDGDAAPGPSSS